MNYKLPPLPESDHVINKFDGSGILGMGQVDGFTAEQMKAYAIAAIEQQQQIEAQGVPDGYAGAAAFVKVMPTVAIHFSTTEQALSFLDQIRASWDRQQRALASAPPAPEVGNRNPQASVVQQEPVFTMKINRKPVEGPDRPKWFTYDLIQQQHVLHKLPEGDYLLYTHPAQQAKPQPLTDEEADRILERMNLDRGTYQYRMCLDAIRRTEAAHGITKE